MYNSEEMQDNQEQGFNNNEGLGNNLVPEGSGNYEGEQGQNQFQQDPNYMPKMKILKQSKVITAFM